MVGYSDYLIILISDFLATFLLSGEKEHSIENDGRMRGQV